MILANRQTTKQHRRGKQEKKQKRKQNRHTKKTDNREKQTSGLQKAPNLQDSIQSHLEESKH
jgi:hypothetical protein